MSRAFDFVVIGVVVIIAYVIHLIGLELFQPGTPLYSLAVDGTETMNGAERADLWYQILTVWMPLIACGGIIAWGVLREYRRQAITGMRAPP